MDKIIVEPKNSDELETLQTYLKQKGIEFKSEEEYRMEKQKQLMKEFAEMVSQSPKADMSDEEIDAIVDEVRAQRYDKSRS